RRQASQQQALLNAYIGRQEERLASIANRTRFRELLAAQAADDPEMEGRVTAEQFRTETGQILHDVRRGTDGGDSRGKAGKILMVSIADSLGRIVASTHEKEIDGTVSNEEAFRQG